MTNIMDPAHPIHIPNGYSVYTRSHEYLINFILANIAEGHHGCSTYGGGGLGKSTAQQYLTDNAPRWLIDEHGRPLGVAARMVMPSGLRRSDRAFWTAVSTRLKLTNSVRLDSHVAIEKLVNWIRTRCGQARVRRMVLFIDNAQRITDAEYTYLEELDSMVLEENLSLFLVLVRQSDAEGVDIGDDWIDRPSHTVRRWFMDTTPFRPLIGVSDITHALGGYDRSLTWPTPDMPFSRYFAREAFDRGWTLASEAGLICETAKKLRQEYKLPTTDAWPMATFTLLVHYLLSDIAARRPDFNGFTEEDIKTALLGTGYLRLEFVRAKMRMPSPTETAERRHV